jgi:hypothetical protein
MRRSLLLVLALLAACDDTTGLSRIQFTLRAGGIDRSGGGVLAFTTDTGWQVTLSEAKMAVGPIYFNVAPSTVEAVGGGAALLRALWPVALARADQQEHAARGRIVAQVTARAILDLLSPQLQEVGPGDGVSEPARSAEVWLLPEDRAGRSGTLPQRSVLYVVGVAQKEADLVPFSAALVLTATRDKPLERVQRATDLVADVPFAPGSGTVVLRVDPRPLFRAADFRPLLDYPPDEAGRRVARPDDLVLRALQGGVYLKKDVYRFTWIGP